MSRIRQIFVNRLVALRKRKRSRQAPGPEDGQHELTVE
jgi:hypothetical protein